MIYYNIERALIVVQGRVQYLVKWKDYPSEQNSWEGRENLLGCRDMIKDYEKSLEEAQLNNRVRSSQFLHVTRKFYQFYFQTEKN